jgi:hypothetical protein
MATIETKKKRAKKTPAPAPATEPAPAPASVPESPVVQIVTPTKGKGRKKVKEPVETPAEKTNQPVLFIDEIDKQPPPPPAKKGRKPPIVASITPEGIHGSLQNNDQRPLIAHLPIHCSDIDSDMFCNTKPKEEKDGVPNPYDPEDVFTMFDQEKQPKNDVEPAIVAQESEEQEQKRVYKQNKYSIGRPSLPIHYSEKLMIRYQDSNREQRLPENIDIACFWDCNSFRSQPCIIPIAIEEGIWRVYGNFCSPECAAAFLFHERLDSHVQWERYALLNRLYSTDEFNDIRLAPPRSVLRFFGGIMDISEFRDITNEKRMRIDVMTPPMISIIQVMDTKPIDFYDASMKNTFIPWEMDRMNRPGAQGLRLQRSKPVVEKESTLEFCMGIMANS